MATDVAFSNIVSTGNVTVTSFQAGGLTPNTAYFWRVRATNACGTGSNSVVRTFTTANEICFTGTLAIPDNVPAGVSNVLTGSSGILTDLNVRLEATHTWVGDLKMTLTHGVTTVAVVDRPGVPASTNGCSANDVAVTADDEGADGNIEAACAGSPPAVTGVRTPNQPLSAFCANLALFLRMSAPTSAT